MSYYRTKPLRWVTELTVQSAAGVGGWHPGSPIEVIALTANPTQIVNLAIVWEQPATFVDLQVIFYTGAAGAEVPVGHRRLHYGFASGDSILNYPFRVPFKYGAGERVSITLQTDNVDAYTLHVNVGYTDNDISDQQTQLTYFAIPDTQQSPHFNVDPSSWTYNGWTLASAGLSTDAYLTGLIIVPNGDGISTPSCEYQAQVALGPSQTVIDTFKGFASIAIGQAQGPNQGHSFARPYPVPAGTEIWMRLAKNGTDVTRQWQYAFEALTAVFTHLGTIRVNKVVIPVEDTTQFDILAGGGLTPGGITLGSGGSFLFEDVNPGSGYSIVESVPAGWSATYDVSNGSQIDNITVANDENVVVTITNTIIPNVFSGIYKIVPGSKKPNDTLWNDLNLETTVDVAIPRPSAKLAPIGN